MLFIDYIFFLNFSLGIYTISHLQFKMIDFWFESLFLVLLGWEGLHVPLETPLIAAPGLSCLSLVHLPFSTWGRYLLVVNTIFTNSFICFNHFSRAQRHRGC